MLCYGKRPGDRQTDRQSFCGAKPEKHIRTQLDVSPPAFRRRVEEKTSDEPASEGVGELTRVHQRYGGGPYILISAVQVNFTLGSGRSLFNFAASNNRLRNPVM